MNIELKDYKYKELCEIMNDKPKSGDSRTAQFTEWKRYFKWEKPTKQTYRVTEVFKHPREKSNNHGGKREGAGASLKLQAEFDYMFNMFLMRQWQRNLYHCNEADWHSSHFTNSEIDTFFGLYNDSIYDALKDDNVNKNLFNEIRSKISEKHRSLIINKMKKLEWVELSDGIIAYITEDSFEYKDDLLEDWNNYQKEYMKNNGYYSVGQIIKNEKWGEMIGFISSKFNKYKKVIKCHKVNFDTKKLESYCMDSYEGYRRYFNRVVVDEIYNSILKKMLIPYNQIKTLAFLYSEEELKQYLNFDEKEIMKEYKYILQNYVLLSNEVKVGCNEYILLDKYDVGSRNKRN